MMNHLLVFGCLLVLAANGANGMFDHVKEHISHGAAETATKVASPFQVSIRSHPFGIHICSGSIIGDQWILTSANCLNGIRSAARLRVRAGTTSLSSGGTAYSIEEIILHPKYNRHNGNNNIALLKVKGSIATNSKVQPIKVADYQSHAESKATVSGWGRLGLFPSKDLKHISAQTISLQECQRRIPSLLASRVTASNVCTDQKPFGNNNGGALVIDGTLVGVVSFDVPFNFRKLPTVYSSIWAYRSWITEQTGI